MIRFDNVSYRYPGRGDPAVNNISLSIERGEFVGIMGRNASGKSTLARLANGLLVPDQGRVEVDGLDSSQEQQCWRIRQKVGLVFAEADRQFVSNIVAEDVAFGPENMGLAPDEIEYRVDTALEMVSMEEFAEHPPYLLSGGQKIKAALAGVFAMQPDYLILDESFSMLDSRTIRDLMITLLKLKETKAMALILISHDLEPLLKADRIVVLDQGNLAFSGPQGELAGRPEKLRSLGVEPLEISLLTEEIQRKSAVKLSPGNTGIDQLVDELCRLRYKE